MSSTSKHPLRKSCGFCRSRKIKCSNETICEACRKQGVDCIYDFEPYQAPSRYVSRSQQQTDTRADRQSPNPGFVEKDGGSPDAVLAASTNIASELETIFLENFSGRSNRTNSDNWQQKASIPRGSPNTNHPIPSFGSHTAKYTGLLSLLTEDLVAMVVNKLGSLGCQVMENGGAKFLVDGLEEDRTDTMFDTANPGLSPLTEYGSRKTTQLIDVWFSTHPLSFLLSKTLVMHELRGETIDEILLAVVLADANFFLGDDAAGARGQALLNYATAKLSTQRLSRTPGSPTLQAGARQSILPHPTVSTVQALTLLGWNALCQSQIRRATCYISLASRLATELKNQKWSATATGAGSRINGIDICEVEKEMVAYLWWINFILTQWMSMQIDQQLPYLPQASLESAFLPVDASSSVLIQLDEASDNLSTVQRQKAALLDIWPLVHISSVIAYICGLYPQDISSANTHGVGFWQEAPGRIHNGSIPQNLVLVQQEIHRVLVESIHVLDGKISYVPSRALVLAVYHTIAIHVLFPSSERGFSGSVLTGDVIHQFCVSADGLIGIITSAYEQTATNALIRGPPQLHPSSAEIFTLALDTCARALSTINSRKGSVHNVDIYTLYESRLRALAIRLDELSQDYFFGSGSSLRAVKRHIKSSVMEFEIGSPAMNYHWQRRPSSSLSTSSASVMEQDHYIHGPPALSPPRSMGTSLASTPLLSNSYRSFVPEGFQSSSIDNSNIMAATGPEAHGPIEHQWFHYVGKHEDNSDAYKTSGTNMHTVHMREIDEASWYQDEHNIMGFDIHNMELNGPVIWQNWATTS
ncbi:uncharacterized protein GGS22DRAFT_199592 [Annulohypoxylon maeteangense]|uniref:uncharacterized protein n=1 Tax=Annulohypoxylon maeteangense TaxID=1927788 RepID=UPI002007EBFE|nr:uncharacterized protein GGS22DRAFT_199592 [Annulohypoxylon maeteangense]KAI0886305.1 hypothetical protein GGS22DRAFT_199592 [Annulohypoxylon maeteangense]